MKVLVIENSTAVCERLLDLLAEGGGYEAIGCAGSSAAALELIETRRPDALLLDMHLDDGSGFRVLEKLRSRGLSVPTIVLSGYDDRQYRLRAESLGAAAYLHKSTQFEDIVPTLRQILGDGGASHPSKRNPQ